MSLTLVALLLAVVAVFGVALLLVAGRAEVRPVPLPVRARYGRRHPRG